MLAAAPAVVTALQMAGRGQVPVQMPPVEGQEVGECAAARCGGSTSQHGAEVGEVAHRRK